MKIYTTIPIHASPSAPFKDPVDYAVTLVGHHIQGVGKITGFHKVSGIQIDLVVEMLIPTL